MVKRFFAFIMYSSLRTILEAILLSGRSNKSKLLHEEKMIEDKDFQY